MIRYAVELRNGNYMKQEFVGSLERINIESVDNPIDATLLKKKEVAQRCLSEILSGNTNFLVLYDDDNPPSKVVELNISFSEIK